MVTIRIVRSRGNFTEGAELDVDEQIARQLMADGTARVVEQIHATDFVTHAATVVAVTPEPQGEPAPQMKGKRKK